MEASQIQHGEPRRLVMSAPTPLRQDFDASQLRGLARKTKDRPQARRLLALAAIYDGATRTEAAKIGGVGLQIIREWIFEEFRITIAKQTLSRELRAMGYRKLSARPRHHAQAQSAIEDFKKASPCAWKKSRARRRSTATR